MKRLCALFYLEIKRVLKARACREDSRLGACRLSGERSRVEYEAEIRYYPWKSRSNGRKS